MKFFGIADQDDICAPGVAWIRGWSADGKRQRYTWLGVRICVAIPTWRFEEFDMDYARYREVRRVVLWARIDVFRFGMSHFCWGKRAGEREA